jgi:PAS domain S-box-containing protein
MTPNNRPVLNSAKIIEGEKLLKQMVTFAEELLKTGTNQVGYQQILENLLAISKAKYGVLTLLDDNTGKFTTVGVAGLKDKVKKATKIIGFDLMGKEWNEYSNENEHLYGQIVSRFSSMSELAGRVLPEIISKSIEKLLNIGEVAVTKVIVNDQMIGDFTLLMPAGKHLENEYLVEIYSRQIELFITRIKADAEINRTKEYFELVFNSSPDANLLTRLRDGLIVNANDGFLVMTGFTRDEVIGKKADGLNLYENPTDRQRILNKLKEKGYCDNEEAVFRRKDGSFFIISLSAKITILHGVEYNFSSTRNITERKLVENVIKESELKYRSLIECSSDAIFCVDEKGQYQFTNLLFASTFEKTPEYFIGKSFWDIYPKAHADYRYEAAKRVFRTGKSESLEVEVPLPDKTLIFYATADPIKDETGKVILVLTHATDITDRKLAEEELAKTKILLEQTFEQSSVPMVLVSMPDTKILIINPACKEHLGMLDEPSAIGVPLMDFKASFMDYNAQGEVQTTAELPLALSVMGTRTINQEGMVVRKDGTTRWQLISANPIYNNAKEIIATFLTLVDISERKLVEQALQASEERMVHIVETVPNGITILDQWGQITFANRIAEEILGLTHSDIANRVYNDLAWKTTAVDGGAFPDEQLPFARVMQTNEPVYGIEHAIEHPDGKRVILSINAVPLCNVDGNFLGMVAALTDITERKQAETKLNEQLEELRRWHAITLGREGRILELKSEVNRLLAESGKPVRYASAEERRHD